MTCAEGIRTRARRCDNPAPSNDGRQCIGESHEQRSCTLRDCAGTLLNAQSDSSFASTILLQANLIANILETVNTYLLAPSVNTFC